MTILRSVLGQNPVLGVFLRIFFSKKSGFFSDFFPLRIQNRRLHIYIYIYIWLRLFCSALFRACPGQLLVYAICKEGYPENPKKKVALVGPDRKEEVRTKSGISKEKVKSFS